MAGINVQKNIYAVAMEVLSKIRLERMSVKAKDQALLKGRA